MHLPHKIDTLAIVSNFLPGFYYIAGMLYVIPSLAVEWGSTKEYGALIVSVAGACEFIQRITIIPLTGYFNVDVYKFVNVCLLSVATGLLSVALSSTTMLLVHGIINGLLGQIFSPVMIILFKVGIL